MREATEFEEAQREQRRETNRQIARIAALKAAVQFCEDLNVNHNDMLWYADKFYDWIVKDAE